MSDLTSPGGERDPGALVVRGARTHNLKGVDSPSRTASWWSSRASAGRASRRWPSTPSTPKGSGATSSRCRPTRASSSSGWKSRTSTAIEGIAPAIAIRQKNSIRNPRSTVGTTTEIHDYLRLLWARVGRTICRQCGREVERESPDVVADRAARRCPTARGCSSGSTLLVVNVPLVAHVRRRGGTDGNGEADAAGDRGDAEQAPVLPGIDGAADPLQRLSIRSAAAGSAGCWSAAARSRSTRPSPPRTSLRGASSLAVIVDRLTRRRLTSAPG